VPFWVCYFHAVWSTKNRTPLITPEIETVIIDAVGHKSAKMECQIMAINCVEDHIHVAVSIPPKVAAAEWIAQAKGLSTHEFNAMYPDLDPNFQWQGGYGALTFGAKRLPFVVDYIQRQKEHHAQATIEPYLERIDDET